MRHLRNLLIGCCCVSMIPSGAAALDTFFASPRAMAMGGANVVSVRDTSAQYYNPAAFGFFNRRDAEGERTSADASDIGKKVWGVDLAVAGGFRLHGDFGNYIDDLADIDLDQLQDGINSGSDLQDLVKLVGALAGVDKADTGLTADANVGLGIRAGNFGIGMRGYGQAAAWVAELDKNNLGFNAPFVADIVSNAAPEDFVFNGFMVLTAEQGQNLEAAGYTAEAVEIIDYYLEQEENITAANIDDAVELLVNVIDATANQGTLENNTTTVVLTGFGVGEIPFTYGWAINDHIAIGGNLKLMRGRVYGNQLLVFDDDSGDLVSQTDENFEETTTFGIDLGVLARYNRFGFGLVGRNLNSPEFDGFTKEIELSNGTTSFINAKSVRIDPQFTAGIAYHPFDTLTVEVNYDLTDNKTAFRDYATRNLSCGLEWDIFKILALRGGVYKNMAESDVGLVYTAGLGLNLWAARLDVAGVFSKDEYTYDGDKIPQETRVAAALSIDF